MSLSLRLAASALLAVTALAARPSGSRACTAFSAPSDAGPILAKSFDWSTGEGWIVLNERGRAHVRVIPGAPPPAPARFASLAFTTAGPGFPISGMNEAGLAIEALVDGSVRPSTKLDPERPTGLELVQYGLDHFGTTAELSAFAEQHGVSQLAIPLHFFACDRAGACVVIEAHADGVHVARGADLRAPVLANRGYASELGASPSPRFATASRALVASPARSVSDAFHILDRVQVPGLTKWHVVWELARGEVHFRDTDATAITSLRVDAAAGRCEGEPRVRAVGQAHGEASFHPWSASDASRAEQSVASQLGGSASAVRLARAVAVATRATKCAVVE